MVHRLVGSMVEVVRDLHRGTPVKGLVLLLVPLVGCSALPGGRNTLAPRTAMPHSDARGVTAPAPEHASATGSRPARSPRAQRATDQLARVPLAFEPAPAAVGAVGAHGAQPDAFIGRAARYSVRVAPTWAEIQPLRSEAAQEPVLARPITMRFDGAAGGPHAVSLSSAPGTVSYFTGPDPEQWRLDLPTYNRVTFSSVYPGIDIAYYGNDREIEYDILVSPGADPARVAMRFEGADAVTIATEGDLAVSAGRETLTLRAPVAYQETDGRRTPVSCRYEMTGPASVRLDVAAYDTTRPLVIDPILSYAALLGGTGLDEAISVKVDATGNVYVAGTTASTNFPGATGPVRGIDVFVAKLNPRGALLYSAYIGGTGIDEARGLAVDADGNAYVAGSTTSTDFPTRLPRQSTLGGETDAFVLKLSTTGAGLIFSTYHGGAGTDEGSSVAIDTARNVYIAGETRSTNLPLVAAHQGTLRGRLDGFVARFAATGSSLTYSTYHGGTGSEALNGIAVDASGNAFVTGSTTSTDFPLAGAPSGSNAGLTDAVVSAFSPAGALSFSTYWGGSGVDVGQAIVVGPTAAFITGTTASANFPASGAIQPQPGGELDAFILVVTPGVGVGLSTYFGGTRSERGRAIALNAAGRLVVIGQTMSSNLPVVRAAQAATGGNRDTFVLQIDPPYNAVSYATYLGGSNNDEGAGAAIDAAGRVFIAGATSYPFPVVQGASDGFVYGLSTATGVDADDDGMPDDWESQYGLDPTTNDANLDTDGDGVSNASEYASGTHPLGFYSRYLAEGSTGTFFDNRIALFNPTSSMAIVLLRYQRPDGASELQQLLPMQPQSRLSVNPETLAGLEGTSFSTVVESDQPVVVDRTMSWDSRGFGSHTETSSEQPSTQWFLAEGATGGTFDLYYLLQNPSDAAADVEVTYLRPAPQAPLTKRYAVAARSRRTINVDNERFGTANQRLLTNTDLSAKIVSDVPILVERAMYMTAQGRTFAAGHNAAGVTAPATSWFLAEGATGPFFDLFILLANPNATPTTVEVTYLLDGGTPVVRTYPLTGNSRQSIYVDADPALSNVSTSAIVRSLDPLVPIVVERAMWWPGGNWTEAHDSAGAIVTSSRWALAEGEVGGTRSNVTYVLIANTSAAPGSVKVTVRYEGSSLLEAKTYTLPGQSRFNIDMGGEFPNTEGTRFSVLVEGLGATPPELVVERAMYSNSGTAVWAAGTNALATPLFPDNTLTVTPNGVFPKVLVVDEGAQVRIVNKDTNPHEISSDEHPTHLDSLEFGSGILQPGQERLTGNLVDPGSFGVHDHLNEPPTGKWEARVIVRPSP